MKESLNTVNAVKCGICGSLHEVGGDTFVSVYGNVCIGLGGGMIGQNLDSEDKVINISIFCRTPKCLKVFADLVEKSAPLKRTIEGTHPHKP